MQRDIVMMDGSGSAQMKVVWKKEEIEFYLM